MSRAACAVLLAGLGGVNSHIQARVTHEMGLLRPVPQEFWKLIARRLDLCARRMVEARLEREEAAGVADTAFAEFVLELNQQIDGLGIQRDQELRLQRLVRDTARAGLSSLIPAAAEHLTAKAKEVASWIQSS